MNFIKTFFSFFSKKKPNTTVSYNNEPIPKNAPSQSELILDKMHKGERLPVGQVNTVLSDYFDIKAVQGNVHKFNNTLMSETVFIIESITVNCNEDKVPVTATIVLKESVFNLQMSVIIDAHTFHEVFVPVELTKIT